MLTSTAKLKRRVKLSTSNLFVDPAKAGELSIELWCESPRLWRVSRGLLGGQIIAEDDLDFTTSPIETGRYNCSQCGRSFLLTHAVSHCQDHPRQMGID